MSPNPLSLALEQAIKFRQKRSVPTFDLLYQVPLSAPDLFSNDYLSLSYDPSLHASALKKLSEASLVLGSGGSRLANGNTAGHVTLESRMKDFFEFPAALLCNSGYDANVVFWRSIPQNGDVVIYDELVHASTRDGIVDCRAKGAMYPFQHNSVSSFRECLARVLAEYPSISSGKATLFIALESLYSMDGDFAPLQEMVEAVEELVPPESAHIVVDEAHSTGIYGTKGRGFVAALGLTTRIHTIVHTFGKARAASGAVILSSAIVRQYIINYGRAFIYSTSMPGALVSILNASFDHIESCAGDEARERLRNIAEQFHKLMTDMLKKVPKELLCLTSRDVPSTFPRDIVSPIFPIVTSHPIPLATHLCKFGYACTPIPYPVVPRGQERIRVVVHAGNKFEEIEELIAHMLEWATTMQREGLSNSTIRKEQDGVFQRSIPAPSAGERC